MTNIRKIKDENNELQTSTRTCTVMQPKTKKLIKKDKNFNGHLTLKLQPIEVTEDTADFINDRDSNSTTNILNIQIEEDQTN